MQSLHVLQQEVFFLVKSSHTKKKDQLKELKEVSASGTPFCPSYQGHLNHRRSELPDCPSHQFWSKPHTCTLWLLKVWWAWTSTVGSPGVWIHEKRCERKDSNDMSIKCWKQGHKNWAISFPSLLWRAPRSHQDSIFQGSRHRQLTSFVARAPEKAAKRPNVPHHPNCKTALKRRAVRQVAPVYHQNSSPPWGWRSQSYLHSPKKSSGQNAKIIKLQCEG